MNRKRKAVFVGIGILAGLALSGPAAQAATSITATPTTQTFYVDGQQVQFEAYSIHNNNFVKLRDIGQAVDFGVTYDAATNSVYIDSTQPYREEVPAAPTEESAGHPGSTSGNLPHRDNVPHALPLHQRRALPPGHPLLRLGCAV